MPLAVELKNALVSAGVMQKTDSVTVEDITEDIYGEFVKRGIVK